jgi:hypothetical protein
MQPQSVKGVLRFFFVKGVAPPDLVNEEDASEKKNKKEDEK